MSAKRVWATQVVAIGAIAVTVALTMSGAASGSTRSTSGIPTLVFGNPTIASDVAVHVAVAKGFFTKHHVNVTIQDNLGANVLNEVASGQVDIANFTAPAALSIAEKGKPTSIIWGVSAVHNGATMYGSPNGASTLKELENKAGNCRISTLPPGTTTYGAAARYDKKLNLNCELVPLPSPAAQVGALAAGRVDAIVGSQANFITAVQQHEAVIIINATDRKQLKATFGTDYVQGAWFGLTSDLHAKKAAVAHFLSAVREARAYIHHKTVASITKTVSSFPAFASLPLAARQTTVANIISGSSWKCGYITKKDWGQSLTGFKYWGIAGFSKSAAVNSYSQRVDMSYYRTGIGEPLSKCY